MALVLVSHDMAVVAETCDRVAVMYAGRLVETAATEALFQRPRHPYTRALMDSLPARRAKGEALYTIPGMPPDLAVPIAGCAFAPRCEHAVDSCRTTRPELVEVGPDHATACLREQAGEL
jgi:oligopeptide/dipeptide ABC transporter ATP-binding protein